MNKGDVIKVLAGFAGGIVVGCLLMKRMSNAQGMCKGIDHVVIRSRDKTKECKKFYKWIGFEIEREMESDEWERTQKGAITFPVVRVNHKQAIDLFPSSTERVWCKETHGQMDHICLVMTADDHLHALKQLKSNNVQCVKQFRAYGAQGYGWSTYFNDPTGLYVEIRNYEQNRWSDIQQFAQTMIINKE